MRVVTHHTPQTQERAARTFARKLESLREDLEDLTEYPGREVPFLEGIVDTCRAAVARSQMAQASVEDVQWTLFLGARAARALFAAADLGYRNDHFIEPMSESVEVELGGKLFSIPPVNGEAPTLSGLSDTSWFQGFYLACIAREAKALARLASPMDYRLAIGDRRSRAVNAAVVGLQALWRDEPELVLKSTKDWADLSDFPWSRFEVPAATAIVNGDSDSLNNALFEMLSAHKAFYDTEKNMFDDHGWLAARPLIFACIAHDRGLSIEVESGYMPKSFVTDELK